MTKESNSEGEAYVGSSGSSDDGEFQPESTSESSITNCYYGKGNKMTRLCVAVNPTRDDSNVFCAHPGEVTEALSAPPALPAASLSHDIAHPEAV